jgi:microcystin degradation protein MlrC
MKRVLIAGLYHETHTFLRGVTGIEDFEIKRGPELLQLPGEGSPLAAAIETARGFGWDVIPVADFRAAPGAVVADEVFDTVWASLQRALSDSIEDRLDGILLVLHGAMVSQSCDDVEGEILVRLRCALSGRQVPICGVIDLHANFTRKMAENADCLIAYRENPHSDAKASAARAAKLLDRLMATRQPCATIWEHPPILWPPTGTGTNADPMQSLEAEARRIEQRHDEILAVNILAGFAFADVADAGVSFAAVTLGEPDAARAELARLAALAESLKHLGNVADMPVADALEKAAAHSNGPVILAEPSDNIGGGAPGDGTGLLRALLEHNIEGAVVIINDPEAVASLVPSPIGAQMRLNIGGKGCPLDPGPIPLEVDLVSRSDGRFTLEDPDSHLASMAGTQIDMGPCAVVRCRGVVILLTSRKTPPFDLGQLRSQGIEPEQQRVIVVKAAVAHRRAYDPIAAATYLVDTPGPCSSNLRSLPYRKIRRPTFPLD